MIKTYNEQTLPEKFEEYSLIYSHRAQTVIPTEGAFEQILKELRAAYIKYPNSRAGIQARADVIKTAIAIIKNKKRPMAKKQNDPFEKNVVKTLF